jgi:hypothetical protein
MYRATITEYWTIGTSVIDRKAFLLLFENPRPEIVGVLERENKTRQAWI